MVLCFSVPGTGIGNVFDLSVMCRIQLIVLADAARKVEKKKKKREKKRMRNQTINVGSDRILYCIASLDLEEKEIRMGRK